MDIGIGAIFRNEREYILEWIEWHRMAGFRHFYLADNRSNDGTRQLLEALSDLGVVDLTYQPILATPSQVTAYHRLAQKALGVVEALLYIDADEFVFHDEYGRGKEHEAIARLMKDESVGVAAINWRTFGSSGLVKYEPKPVIQRFTHCARDSGKLCANQHVKSVVRVRNIVSTGPHICRVTDNLRYVDTQGKEIDDFIVAENGQEVKSSQCEGRTARVRPGPLRVHHYVIKSKDEYLSKKRSRGSAMKGADFDRGLQFFDNHDFQDETFEVNKAVLARLREGMDGLERALKERTPLYRELRGYLDRCTPDFVEGWLTDNKGLSDGLSINVFVNDTYVGSCAVGSFRSDLKRKRIARNGHGGFRFYFPRPLSVDDCVSVSVHASSFSFKDDGIRYIQ
ncbi:glycosyltransferase family 2 protein [Marinimicrobium sp. ARAG 43.8]|uniref:glycosyltransferase family 2 protein n=1 Tax=Marinimicrobium sp. ARAG 43.8 TaxID=3418719 RepID=UPI003CF391B4